jgi:hypothetical protein
MKVRHDAYFFIDRPNSALKPPSRARHSWSSASILHFAEYPLRRAVLLPSSASLYVGSMLRLNALALIGWVVLMMLTILNGRDLGVFQASLPSAASFHSQPPSLRNDSETRDEHSEYS